MSTEETTAPSDFWSWYYGSEARTEDPLFEDSPIFPQELVEMIISYLANDTRALLACSKSSHSFYIAAKPYLHYSLTIYDMQYPNVPHKYHWPTPLKKLSQLQLLKFTNRLRIHTHMDKFTPQWLDSSTLSCFLELKNLQELQIDSFQVSSIVPDIQKCFTNFAPTLQCLHLRDPIGTCSQLLYFIGMFPKLQDLHLYLYHFEDQPKCQADLELTPTSIPDLCGRLTLVGYRGEMLVRDMIKYFNGIHFCYMHLRDVKCTRLLLEECGKALKTLWLSPIDSYASTSAFNLSNNRSLRALETNASLLDYIHDAGYGFFKAVLSTIRSSQLLDIILTFSENDVGFPIYNTLQGPIFQADGPLFLRKEKLFHMLQMVYSVQEFQLVFCAEALRWAEKFAVEELNRMVEEEEKSGGLGYCLYRPLVTCQYSAAQWSGCYVESIPGCLLTPNNYKKLWYSL